MSRYTLHNATSKRVLAHLELRSIPAMSIGQGSVRRRQHTTGQKQAGMWDIYATLPSGRAWWIEIKTGEGKLSLAQIEFGALHGASRAQMTVLRETDDVMKALDQVINADMESCARAHVRGQKLKDEGVTRLQKALNRHVRVQRALERMKG